MKKTLFLFASLLILAGCNDKQSKAEKQIEAMPDPKMKVVRFDKAFFETPVAGLAKLKAQYPEFFPPGNSDSVWTSKMTAPLWRELYKEVELRYNNFDPERAEIEQLYKHIKFYYPAEVKPTIATVIGDVDYNTKALYVKGYLIIALEMYLGKDHRFYDFPKYISQNCERRQIMPDIAKAFAEGKIPAQKETTLLAYMIQAGKELYIKDLLLPEYNDAEKIGYTTEQEAFCRANEDMIWKSFIEEKYLYSTDASLEKRFIDPAPFSKFYADIDNDTPGRIGTWTGWQIVRAYMKNNDVTLPQLLQADASEIFNKSHYKPAKNG